MPETTNEQTTQQSNPAVVPNQDQGQQSAPDGKTLLGSAATTVTSTPEGAAAPDGAEAVKTTESEPQVPEKYELKAPEGTTLDESAVEAFTPVAKEMKLTNDQAQKLTDLYAQRVAAERERQVQDYMKTVESWKDQVTKDQELGGDNLGRSIDSCKRALSAYDTNNEFLNLMEKSGFGNHPAVFRFMAKVGAALKEDKSDVGGSNRGGSLTQQKANHIFYDKS